jgi:hypothetical protein
MQTHVSPDQKKRSMSVVLGENIEQMESVRIVGPIVESQRNYF